jgi:hypothetical protein
MAGGFRSGFEFAFDLAVAAALVELELAETGEFAVLIFSVCYYA